MKKHEIKIGGLYAAKVGGMLTTVRVDEIVERPSYKRFRGGLKAATFYVVTDLETGRNTTFRSAMKFRGLWDNEPKQRKPRSRLADKAV